MTRTRWFARRVRRDVVARVRPWAVHLGLARYRPGPWSRQRWDEKYDNGELDYFRSDAELPRYSVLVGYLAALERQGHVLDVGCGQGILFDRCRAVPFTRWCGVDLSATAVDQANALANRLADQRADFTVGDLLDPTWQPDSGGYDVVVLNEVLNMCDDPAAMLRRVASVLRPDGTLLVSGWHHTGDRALWKLIHTHFRELDAAEVRSTTSTLAPRGWRVARLQVR